jgi:hypothetical protein
MYKHHCSRQRGHLEAWRSAGSYGAKFFYVDYCMLTTNEEKTEGSLDRVDVENDGAPLNSRFSMWTIA